MKKVAWVLVIIGALNWGLVGLGWLVGQRDWNVVHMILGKWMTVEAIVYLLVGLAAIKFFFCRCAGCKNSCTCSMCGCGGKKGGDMGGAPKAM